MRPAAQAKGLDWQVHRAPSLPNRICTDPARVRQCLINLIGNAIKFTESGHVILRVEPVTIESKPMLQFEIEDTGIGIPPDKQQTIFEPFSQADGSTTRRFGGTGLGLAITRQLIRLMGGRITLTSEPGKGSTFSMTIPLQVECDSCRDMRRPRMPPPPRPRLAAVYGQPDSRGRRQSGQPDADGGDADPAGDEGHDGRGRRCGGSKGPDRAV